MTGIANAELDRVSGMWGAQTPLGLWLEENQITTLFFGGVNSDQCVVCCSAQKPREKANLGCSMAHS